MPALQFVQTAEDVAADSGLNVPSEHSVHEADPDLSVYVPAGQRKQDAGEAAPLTGL